MDTKIPTFKVRPTAILFSIGLAMLAGCGDEVVFEDPYSGVTSENVVLDPTGAAPLTAVVELETMADTSVTVRVVGRHGPASDVIHAFPGVRQKHNIEVLGLYGGHLNIVELTFHDARGRAIGLKSYTIETEPLVGRMPDIEVEKADIDHMAPGMTLISYFPESGEENTPQLPVIFDAFGDIRWYLNFAWNVDLHDLFYDVGIERLQNGNLYFGDRNSHRIYEVDMLGRILNTWDLPGYKFHHNVQEKPDGNFLVTVSRENAATVQDYIIEINRDSKEIVNEWDLNSSLENSRRVFRDDAGDWIHVNAVIYDERDDSIIFSARYQGVFKLTRTNEVVWILSPHSGWGKSGDDIDLSRYLLTPLDSEGEPISDTSVLNGGASTKDFDWPWYAHAPQIMPDGTIMLFDNGTNRHFEEGERYSRAVEYDISESDLTVRQTWSYGKERGTETYALSVSDVDYLPGSNHVIFSPGNASNQDYRYGKVIELDYETREIIFEAKIIMPSNYKGITFHRAERLSLYP